MTANKKNPMTDKQRAARLENLKKAHGPKTADGKARSAQNATNHGYWARPLRAIVQGPLREDPEEMEKFVQAYLAELNPGDSTILRQAALDVADKAWRLTRAQRWEAEGYSGADYKTMEAASAAHLRSLVSLNRHHAEVVRRFPDAALSDDDLVEALCALSFATGLSEEDLDWVDEADRTAVVDALDALFSEHFADQDEAASHLDASAVTLEDHARQAEDMWRPHIIRGELDGSFARNAERIVSHASREFDRALKRYESLEDRFGVDDHVRDDKDQELSNEDAA